MAYEYNNIGRTSHIYYDLTLLMNIQYVIFFVV